jgi:hypothetical protein
MKYRTETQLAAKRLWDDLEAADRSASHPALLGYNRASVDSNFDALFARVARLMHPDDVPE